MPSEALRRGESFLNLCASASLREKFIPNTETEAYPGFGLAIDARNRHFLGNSFLDEYSRSYL